MYQKHCHTKKEWETTLIHEWRTRSGWGAWVSVALKDRRVKLMNKAITVSMKIKRRKSRPFWEKWRWVGLGVDFNFSHREKDKKNEIRWRKINYHHTCPLSIFQINRTNDYFYKLFILYGLFIFPIWDRGVTKALHMILLGLSS